MRQSILQDLATIYSESDLDIRKRILECKHINSYSVKIINKRAVIDKSKVEDHELITLDYYKMLLNKYGSFRFPNRSNIMSELMHIIPYLKKYNSFTIYKFDIEKFFYNINPSKILSFVDDKYHLKSHERQFIKKYLKSNKILYPGIGLHNSLIEILGNEFDKLIREYFNKKCIFFSRYVDDGIIILDEKIDEKEINRTIKGILKATLGGRLEFNKLKTNYFNNECKKIDFEYLGYHFSTKQNGDFEYGIARTKIDKYEIKIREILREYQQTKEVKKLDFSLELLFKRVVYYGNKSNDVRSRWQVRGLSDSYKELKRFIDPNDIKGNINSLTYCFFTNSIKKEFNNLKEPIPKLIKNKIENRKYLANFYKNRTVLLHPNLGWSYKFLAGNLKENLGVNDKGLSYEDLAAVLLKHIK